MNQPAGTTETPGAQPWWARAVVYQIYPRSFNDSNGDGIGDIPGITAKLPYLRDLGVDVLWLSPVYASPNDDNGYDISDYRSVMPEFGTMDDLRQLFAAAHGLGLKIMMDLVVNHTSDEHEWFRAARSSIDSAYRDYYVWRDPADTAPDGTPLPPNNWISAFSPSAWEYDEASGQFYLHLFSRKQPDLNWENPRVRAEVHDIMRFWLDQGVDGFRMDVINMISKDTRFPDDPAAARGSLEPVLDLVADGPRVHEFLNEMHREVLAGRDVMTVGEMPGVSTTEAKLYTDPSRRELDMVFQFEHMGVDASPEGYGKWSDTRFRLTDLKRILADWQTALADTGWNSLYWNNHDQPRAVSRFSNDSPEHRRASATMLATTLHGLRGTPYVYQGEELGLTNTAFERLEDYRDLEIHHAYRAYVTETGRIGHEDMMRRIAASGRDNARTPMPWTGEANAGFTDGTPWIRLNPSWPEINAEAERAAANSVFGHYQRLIALRHETPILVDGRFELLEPEDDEVFAYLRHGTGESAGQTLLVASNFTDHALERLLPEPTGEPELLLGNRADSEVPSGGRIALRPYEAVMVLYR